MNVLSDFSNIVSVMSHVQLISEESDFTISAENTNLTNPHQVTHS